METYLLCIKGKLPKYLAFIIIKYIPYEKFKYKALVTDCSRTEIIEGACRVHNRALLDPITETDIVFYTAAKYNFVSLIKELEPVACMEMGLCGACAAGNAQLVQYFVDRGTAISTTCFLNAVNYPELLCELVLLGYNNINIIARTGYRYDIKFLRHVYNHDNWQECYEAACSGGHMALVQETIIRAKDLVGGLKQALLQDQEAVAIYLVDIIGPAAKHHLVYACFSGSLKVVKQMLKYPGSVAGAFNAACHIGHFEMAKIIYESGPVDVYTGLREARHGGNEQLILYLEKLISIK